VVSLKEVKYHLITEEKDQQELRWVREKDKKKQLANSFILKLSCSHTVSSALGDHVFYFALQGQRDVDVWKSLLRKCLHVSQLPTLSPPTSPRTFSLPWARSVSSPSLQMSQQLQPALWATTSSITMARGSKASWLPIPPPLAGIRGTQTSSPPAQRPITIGSGGNSVPKVESNDNESMVSASVFDLI